MPKNWKEIHQNFTPELQKEWEKRRFSYETCQAWINFGCQPNEAGLADYLIECQRHRLNNDVKAARAEYPNWKNLSLSLEVIMQWKSQGFTVEQTKEWLDIGLTPQDSFWCAWLRDAKKLRAKQVNNDNKQQLRREYYDASSKTRQWLNKNYPNKRIKEININEQLEGELDLRDYDNLWKVFIFRCVDKGKFKIRKGSYKDNEKNKETEIIQLVNPQEYLQQKYSTKEEREKVEKLDIRQNNLEGELDFSDFSNLEELNCHNNKFTSLNLNSCGKLKKVDCSDNYLINITYPTNHEQLTELNISSNNLPEQDLSVFSKFTNLQELRISNSDEEKIKKAVYNRFKGNIEPLKNLENLKILEINNTDVDFVGLKEFLPNSIEEIYYNNDKKREIKKSKQSEKSDSGVSRTEVSTDTTTQTDTNEEKRFKIKKMILSGVGKMSDSVSEKFKVDQRKPIYPTAPQLSVQLTTAHEGSETFPGGGQPKLKQDEKKEEIVVSESSSKKIESSLKLEGFDKLRKLTIFSHQLVSLNVTSCSSLEELDCSSNQLDSLNVTDCNNLKKINCSNNKIKELDLSTCPNLEEVNINNCPKELNEKTIKTNLSYDMKKKKLVKVVRNVLIIGKAGSGKSALANLLLNDFEKKDNFKEIFKESKHSTSETRDIKSEKVVISGIEYRIIDTIGFGGGNDEEKIASNIVEACREVENGLTQVLFTVGGRFTLGEIDTYNIISKRLFDDKDEGIEKFTTIVRTRFPYFQNEDKYEEDLNLLKKENEKFSKLINSCNNRVIYIDNPSLSFVRDEDEKDINKEIKKVSRDKLVKHLEKCQVIYKSENLELINKALGKYLSKDKQPDRSLNEVLKEKKKEIESKGVRTKLVRKAGKELKEFSREKLKTAEEIESSSLKAIIEMNDRCNQM